MLSSTSKNLNNLKLSDVYSLMLFILYKTQDIPEYATLSELCFLLDSHGINRLLTYFAGKTVTFPTEKELVKLVDALLVYDSVNLSGKSLTVALEELQDVTAKQKEEITDLYLRLIPIMKQYNIDRGQL